MTDNFQGRTFIITGAASGIGLATARQLKQRGARLVLWDRDGTRLAQAAAALESLHSEVDVTDIAGVSAALQTALGHLGRLDGVIHSAGILRSALFEKIDLETHRRLIEINFFGSVNVAHQALPHLRQTRGSLVFLSSLSAFYGPPEFAVYGGTKAAILNMAQALRIEWQASGIHIGVVCPHFVDTPLLDDFNRQARIVKRFGAVHTPDEVAAAVLRGIQRRHFMIYPSGQVRLIFWVSRALNPTLGHWAMRSFWR